MPSNPSQGLIGASLDNAKRHDLFRWFHLEQEGDPRKEGRLQIVAFRPSGVAFHDLVLVSLWIEENGAIQRLRLTLARRFVNDPRQGMFARDIAKSVLRATFRSNDPPELRDLVNEIEFGRAGNSAP